MIYLKEGQIGLVYCNKKSCYDNITLIGMGVEVSLELITYINHETLISHWMGTENLLRGEGSPSL